MVRTSSSSCPGSRRFETPAVPFADADKWNDVCSTYLQIRFGGAHQRPWEPDENGVGSFTFAKSLLALKACVDELLDLVLRNVRRLGLAGIEHRHCLLGSVSIP